MSDDIENGDDLNSDEPIKAIAPLMGDSPIAPAHGIATIALSLALKYHDINTVQDGLLYQQYKLEGKNMRGLHLDHVFETAIRIEAHILASSDRIAGILVDAITAEDAPPDGDQSETASDTP